MPDFTEVGFLGDELTQFRANVRTAHAAGFHYMEQANALAMRIIWTLPLADLDEAMAHAIMCYARAVQNFQGVILMSERGAVTEARILLRSLAETLFLALGLFEKPDMLERLREDHAAHCKGVANAVIQMNIAGRTGADLSRFEQTVAEVTAEYGERPRSIKWSALAYEVGVGTIHEAAYRFTSGDAAHATLEALNRHVQAKDGGDMHQFIFNPTDEGLGETFRAGLASMVKLMELAVAKLGAGQFEEDLQNLILELRVYCEAI
ncbi:hypothetical protein FPJ27_32870 [Burkholderia sp. MS455]|uniref:DUF5677 domain-containing protein n=1 Tax=Burkholderia sp. MS455 TaxID=2811788 RepID=UPI00195EFB4E|nr:DUF5677 domain-containing protein [Burkholderia sp. MS455]QRR10921.1 hypothetical protein FPJ27_32870 [Burkholderia sp. MS455]